MSGLQTATTIVELVFMGLYIIVLLGIMIGGLVAIRKLKKAQASLEDKLSSISNLTFLGSRLFGRRRRR
ncbi:MAG TPA: hypothetical protein VFN51_01925 [Candidatus Saccharimonadales bacterium]|nr:hypothetical protein [Candidatus Saccharimonadales bacterium]